MTVNGCDSRVFLGDSTGDRHTSYFLLEDPCHRPSLSALNSPIRSTLPIPQDSPVNMDWWEVTLSPLGKPRKWAGGRPET